MNLLFIFSPENAITGAVAPFHIFNELKYAGHSVFTFDPSTYSDIDEAQEKLVAFVKENKNNYDLVVSLHGDNLLRKNTVRSLKSTGIPNLLICFDNLQTPYMHRNIASEFDLVWLTSFETQYLFRKWGCNCTFLPYAANPHSLQPVFSKEINAVGFVGTPYGTRINKINDLIDNGVPFMLYSSDNRIVNKSQSGGRMFKITDYEFTAWKFSIGRRILWSKVVKKFTPQPKTLSDSPILTINPSVSFSQMNTLYSDFALSLNMTEVWDTYVLKNPIHKVHLRTFEIPMCGGLQFSPYLEEIANYFEEDKEIIFYRDKNEYIDKAKFYLQEKLFHKRMEMKKAARLRAEKEHTWTNRFNRIFDIMNLHGHV
jgi:hypothetical protein